MSLAHPMAAFAGRPPYYPRSERVELIDALQSVARRLSTLRESAAAASGVRQRAEINGAQRILECERRALLKRLKERPP